MLENENFRLAKIEMQKEYFSIKLYDKKEKFNFWLDCNITEDNYIDWEFNQYIFNTYNDFDMFFENYQKQEKNINNIIYFIDYFENEIIDYVKKNEKI